MANNDPFQEYLDIIQGASHSKNQGGIPVSWIPEKAFPHQKYVIERSIEKGRYACFLDTGMGKTLIELTIAYNYAKHTNKPVLILTPLSVAFQFLKEADFFGIDDISYSKKGEIKTKIVVANYERLHYFNPDDFCCVICDESSCLKNSEGVTSADVDIFVKKVKYRFLATATPSPNDFIELGMSSQVLGYLGYTDMLTKFFTNNEDTIKPQNIGTEWRLKGHAEDAFFKWVSSWSISMRKPSDLGFSNVGYDLPNLIENNHWVKNQKPLVINGQHQLFNIVAKTNSEIQAERKATIEDRCIKAVELSSKHDVSVYWCNLDKEAEYLRKNDKSAFELKGKMSIEQKEEIILAFVKGEIKKLITKPRITAFGLNWQHCGHSCVFPTFSHEQYYQLVRRFYRFGRKDDVFIDRVFSDGQIRILQALDAKSKKSDDLFTKLNQFTNQRFDINVKPFDKTIQLPNFL
jgi:hypothetical protein